MKILVVSQYFYPENFRINDLVKELKKRGHEITVLTSIPNYPQGEFYEGYGYRRRRVEDYQGIKVIRAFQLPRRRGSLNLFLNYVSFILGGCIKAGIMKDTDFEVIYAFGTSPITQALPAIMMKKRIGKPVLFNVQDLWPENVIVLTGLKNKFLLSLLDRLVDYIYGNCDKILVPSQSFLERIRSRRFQGGPEKVVFWPQYAVVEGIDPARERGSFGGLKELQKIRAAFAPGAFHIVFTGNIGAGQGLDMVVEAAGLLKAERICWHLVGSGRDQERIRGLIDEQGVKERVFLHGPVPEKAIPALLHEADAALLIMRPDPIFDLTIPAKFQTYLACGAAVLGCVGGESRRLIEESGCGLCTKEQDPRNLAKKAKELAKATKEELMSYRSRALSCSRQYFVKDRLVTQLEEMMGCIH